MADVRISRLGSLNFDHDWRIAVQSPVCYVQKFLASDTMNVQFSTAVGDPEPNIRLTNIDTGNVITVPADRVVEYDGRVYYTWNDFLTAARWLFEIVDGSATLAQTRVNIVDEFPDSVLFQYTNYRNDFGTEFSGEPFNFRVEAMILPSEVEFASESEGFNDQQFLLSQLSAFPHESQTLTVGGGSGVPNWVARKLNYIFSLSNVTMDGVPYVRGEGSNPEITEMASDYPLYLYKLVVRDNKTPEIYIP